MSLSPQQLADELEKVFPNVAHLAIGPTLCKISRDAAYLIRTSTAEADALRKVLTEIPKINPVVGSQGWVDNADWCYWMESVNAALKLRHR